jgi:formylglycine-generating enzyme required for sulfatase activity
LADLIGEQPADAGRVSVVLREICAALREIHDAGMAHPELSPRDIRLLENGRAGIASLPAPPPNATLMVTEPKYAAPEVLLAHTADDGAMHLKGDIYVLGFICYEALAGREAFRKQLAGEPEELEKDLFWLKWHADRAARLEPLNDVNPSVPREFSALIQRMIEKDPAARLGRFDDLELALAQLERRLETTDDIELSPAPVAGEVAAPKSGLTLRVALLVCALAAGAAGIAAKYARLTAWWSEARHRVEPAPTPAALPTRMETPTGPMVLVPAGRFLMGSSAVANEGPVHTVFAAAYYIDEYEVTNGRYRAFTDGTGYSQPPAPSWDPEYFAKSSHPVLNVSWRDAQAFCAAGGKRLPTEAEWEKAARGGSPSSRQWANWTVAGLANLPRAESSRPAAVGAFAADVSPFGAHDMAGNVHEWVNDHYGLYDGNPATLDKAAGKVVRGGSFALAPPDLSPSWRASLDPVIAAGSDSPVGFRCAADPGTLTPPRAQSRP